MVQPEKYSHSVAPGKEMGNKVTGGRIRNYSEPETQEGKNEEHSEGIKGEVWTPD
jgi:hypothetical protein